MTSAAPPPGGAIASPPDLAQYIDHTLLAETASEADIDRLCDEAREHRFAAVCVRAPHVSRARRRLEASGVRVAAVVDFPLGERSTAERVGEARAAVDAGAEELDLVAPLPALLTGRWEEARRDLAAVIAAAPVPVKVILETGLLTPDQAAAGAAICRAAGAAMVKTSTGFGRGGATVEAVALLRAVVGPSLGVKASGGVRTASQARALLAAGASRLGASASVAIVTGRFDP